MVATLFETLNSSTPSSAIFHFSSTCYRKNDKMKITTFFHLGKFISYICIIISIYFVQHYCMTFEYIVTRSNILLVFLKSALG